MERKSFRDCDYFRIKEGAFFIVRGNYHSNGYIRALPVFYPDHRGNYYHHLLKKNFTKCINIVENINWLNQKFPSYFHQGKYEKFGAVSQKDIIEKYSPKICFKKHRLDLQNTIWGKIIREIHLAANIPYNDMGIFGSYLLGFNVTKDIDFLVYGKNNCRKLKEKFSQIINNLNFCGMSHEHNLRHVEKYSQVLDKNFTDFLKIGERRWSAIQVSPNVLTTIRFVYKKSEIPSNPIKSQPFKEIEVEGKVVDDFDTNFMPRSFKIKSNGKIFEIISYFWCLQSCVKIGDLVKIRGTLHQDKKTINIFQYNHGIKILN